MTTTLTTVRGNTDTFSFADTRSGAPYDLTGASIAFTVKRDEEDAANLFQKTVGSGTTVTSAANGLFSVLLADTDTNTLPNRRSYLKYDVKVTKSGVVKTIQRGDFVVLPNVG